MAKHEEDGKVELFRLVVIHVGPYFEGALRHKGYSKWIQLR